MTEKRSVVDYAESDQSKRDYWDREAEIEKKIERCSRALARESPAYYRYVAKTLDEEIIPLLEEHAGRRLPEFDEDVGDSDDWDYGSVIRFYKHRKSFEHAFNGCYEHLDLPTREESIRILDRTLRSVAVAAESEEVIMSSYASKADASGFGSKVGEHLQAAKMNLGDPVQIISDETGAVKTLYAGGTGQGKSATLETEAFDFYSQNFDEDGEDYKIIDLVGTGDGENWFYDVPLRDGELREIRSDMDLPETVAEMDIEPEAEILLPLTHDLDEQPLPFDVDAEEFVVRPYTVPAADIRKPLLISMISTKLTNQQEQVIRDAYDEVDMANSDWCLRDLADEIRARDDLPPDKIKGPIRTLRQLQRQGFIRTRDSPYRLDWRDVFESTETITIFSQSFIPDEIGRLINIGYLLHQILKERESMPRLPKCLMLMRELWTVAPHTKRQSFDTRAAELQESTAHVLGRILRVNRRRGLFVKCDTQWLTDLHKAIRESYNRYVLFRTNQDIVRDVFEWTANSKWRACYSTLNEQSGTGTVVGMTEPSVQERNIEFVGPVVFAPPPHHHFDEDSDHTGWHSRARYFSPIEDCPECEHESLERSDDGYTVECPECGEERRDLSGGRCEELRAPKDVDGVDWPVDLPRELQFSERRDKESSDEPHPVETPVAAFCEECIVYDKSQSTMRKRVYAAFNQWSFEHDERDDSTWDFDDRGVSSRFGRRISTYFEPKELGTTTVEHKSAWKNIRLSPRGEAYLERALDQNDGLEDAIQG